MDNVYLSHICLTKLPSSLPKTVRNFTCSYNELTDLTGSPDHVDRLFDCSNNELSSLIGSPSQVGGLFDCKYNNLTNLIGSPNYVGGHFNCESNRLTSLLGVPKIIKKDLYILLNSNLLYFSDIWDSDIGGAIFFNLNPEMAILPLIKFCDICSGQPVVDEIHKRNRGSLKLNILDFQYDLIENGFGEHAKW